MPDMRAVKEALANIRRGRAANGVTVHVYPGAAQPGDDSEAHGEADDKAPVLPGDEDEDE